MRRHLERVLPQGAPPAGRVRITQDGELSLKPGGRWLQFSAVQDLEVREVEFLWTATVRMLPLLSVRVVDRYSAGEGTSEVRLLGLPIQRDSGEHLGGGAAQRYLAELPWNPCALLANEKLEWRELDERTVEVSTADAPAPVRLRFDDEGKITAAWTDARLRKEGHEFVVRPWGGVFSAYDTLGGIGIPTRAEVTWDLPGDPWTWFRCRVTTLQRL